MLKSVFFGTPSVAVPFLERLAKTTRVVGVVASPDKPAGRGYQLAAPPVKIAAEKLGLPVHQPPSLKTFSLRAALGRPVPYLPLPRDPTLLHALKDLSPDVAAFRGPEAAWRQAFERIAALPAPPHFCARC